MRNMEQNRLLLLAEQIPVRPGAVISQNLERRAGGEITLYSFGNGEGISEQTLFGDVLYYVLGGMARFGLPGGQRTAKAGDALLAKAGTPHWVEAEGGLQILYIQVFQRGDEKMYIKNFVQNEVVELKEQIGWETGKVVSRTLVQREDMTMTLFAFDQGEGVSTHAAAGDAMVVVLDGTAQITVDGVVRTAGPGQSIIMPANIPHSVKAVTPYKMLLIVVKPEKEGK